MDRFIRHERVLFLNLSKRGQRRGKICGNLAFDGASYRFKSDISFWRATGDAHKRTLSAPERKGMSENMTILIVVIVLLLLFGGGGYGYRRWSR